jgi:hypothetical protein
MANSRSLGRGLLAVSLLPFLWALSPQPFYERRAFLIGSTAAAAALCVPTTGASAKCTDIESCREIGERKMEQELKDNPVTTLGGGVRYKQLKPGFGDTKVDNAPLTTTVDLIYSITSASGQYMYSQGFGFEKIDIGNGLQNDLGLDSYRVSLGTGDLPMGIEAALMGMKKGERRRVELPPNVGFETSNWKPEPTTRRGKASIKGYQSILRGRGSSQPPFPAETIWDVEVLSFKNKPAPTTLSPLELASD